MAGTARKTISYLSSPWQIEWKRESGQSGGGHGSRPARCIIRLVARPSGPVSKVICEPVTLAKKFFSLSANSSNLGPAMAWPLTCAKACAKRRSPSRVISRMRFGVN